VGRGALSTHPAFCAQVQQCTLMSIKTGGCPEDCGYCSQSSKHKEGTGLKATKLAGLDEMYEAAVRAKAAGSTRFCMGAAWRGPSQVGEGQFGRVLEATQKIRALGLEACVTAGMLTDQQAGRLADAGLTAYNHNLDTSPEHYDRIITTRTYQERLETLARVRRSGITLCCGGIIGMGEGPSDRAGLLEVLANLEPHPESVPINALVAVEGTPFENQHQVDPLDLVRMVAAARILMPHSRVRMSAGREQMNREAQILCLLAGADSIFYGETLLTTGNPDVAADRELLAAAGVSVSR